MTYHRVEEVNEKTPWEKCRALLIELRLEQLKQFPSPDRLAQLYAQITTFPVRTVATAFDSVVDDCGWTDNGVTPDA